MTLDLTTWRPDDGRSDLTLDGSGSYRGYLQADAFARNERAVTVVPSGGYPTVAYHQPQPRELRVTVDIISGSFVTGQDALAEAFEPGLRGQLIINDGSINRALRCRVQGLTQQAEGASRFVATLVSEDPRWYALSRTSTSGTIAANGDELAISNGGSAVEDRAVFTITPKAAKATDDGQQSRFWVNVANRVKAPLPLYPIVIELDHATEVAAGRSLSNGNDLRPVLNGVENPRWLLTHTTHDANSAATRMLTPISFAAGLSAKLFAALPATRAAGIWELGEASGTEPDTSGNSNTGTVTIGAGTRDATGLYRGSNGCIDFDGAATVVSCGTDTSIDNIFDGGGAIFFTIEPDSDGEGDAGVVVQKEDDAGGAGWKVYVSSEAGGFVRLNFQVDHATTDGLWHTAVDVPINDVTGWCIAYDDDAVANNPVFYRYEFDETGRVERIEKLTVGNGLTESTTPSGAYQTDAAQNLLIGNNTTAAATFDGKIDKVVALSSTPTDAQIRAYPFAEGDLEVERGGTEGWPAFGKIMHPTTFEVIAYDGLTLSNENGREAFQNVRRAQRGSSLASASASDTVWWSEHELQLLEGWTLAALAAPDQPAGLKPMLDLSLQLSNVLWGWTEFADTAYPERPASWRHKLLTVLDGQARKVLANLGAPAGALTLEYQSGGPQSDKPSANAWELQLPVGTGSSGGNVLTHTRALSDTMGMRISGDNDEGDEVTLEDYAGALASGSDNVTAPTDPMYALRVWGFNQVVASRPEGTYATASTLDGSNTNTAQQFTTGTEAIEVSGCIVGITDSSSAQTVQAELHADNGSDAPNGTSIASGNFVTAGGDETAVIAFSAAVVLQPNTQYWLTLQETGGAPFTTAWYRGAPSYSGGLARVGGVNSNASVVFNFRIIGKPADLAASLVRCDTNSVADDSDTTSITAISALHLSSTGTPVVNVEAREAIVQLRNAELEVLLDGVSYGRVVLNAVAALEEQIEIDVTRRAQGVVNLQTGERYSNVRVNDRGWLRVPPNDGATTPGLRYSEDGYPASGVALQVDWRARYG